MPFLNPTQAAFDAVDLMQRDTKISDIPGLKNVTSARRNGQYDDTKYFEYKGRIIRAFPLRKGASGFTTKGVSHWGVAVDGDDRLGQHWNDAGRESMKDAVKFAVRMIDRD